VVLKATLRPADLRETSAVHPAAAVPAAARGLADAFDVKPPKPIAAAANPIAILRRMMLYSFALSTLAFANQTHRL
jgi:hypothetical protein